MFETLDSLIKVRKKALALAKGWHIIDANNSIEETHASINSILDKLDGKMNMKLSNHRCHIVYTSFSNCVKSYQRRPFSSIFAFF
ncbi:MAG: hypothetical protein J7K95_06595 [Thermoplasmata archaeon]|nr:hypothetical protein [Thermoplasmata archaeon]